MAEDGNFETLDSARLLSEWRWLCPQPLSVIGRNAFGDLFLEDEAGKVHLLNVGSGEFSLIAASVYEFTELARTLEKREIWFAEAVVNDATTRGLVPGPQHCIGFSTPVVFAESNGLDSAYIADLYEHVGFLGDIHRQIATLPDGTKARFGCSACEAQHVNRFRGEQPAATQRNPQFSSRANLDHSAQWMQSTGFASIPF